MDNRPKAAVLRGAVASFLVLLLSHPVMAQTEGPDPLKIYFDTNASVISGDGLAILDQAARLFRDGNPIVMIVAGGSDTVGDAEYNLQLSIARAEAVAQGLAQRGIPANRLQVLGRGTSELPVQTGEDVDNRENRVVEISWR